MIQADAYHARLSRLRDCWCPAPDKPEETPETTLLALWWTAAGTPRSAVTAAAASPAALDADAEARLDALLAQRIAGVPLAHLTGRQHFMGMDLLAGPGALIPRAETELLARAAIELARAATAQREILKVIDVCTGCGNLALAIAREVAGARVVASDLSEEAVALARRNAAALGLDGNLDIRCGDLLAPFDTPEFQGEVGLLVCNPPYISSGKVPAMAPEIAGHEPALAFDGGPLGVSILTRLVHDAPRFLRAGGWLAFEVGVGQGPAMARRLRNERAFDKVRELHDDAGIVRVVLACRGEQAEAAA
ncbi:peptide chain release factor N(5)-glutamine methyltransferase [Luteimonas sp. M1R5S18]|uniref:peptide chain release factor N(5)-glutamine methyltransferase n=1 Tax=Luteimonas rhizosphaericola TaxID=3042024 RepID=A0ABT6JJN4_9GAMM|nr:peptide chain release factor N(5)-glutamine methyltransferase [Luteimonas rhizosphaericola]MDH5830700.1 peptide chain release factor N(5)-glutamine methyltransferase [Luteimonas rhizosphaericola]